MAPIKIKTFLFPRILSGVSLLLLTLLAVWYILFQARFLISGPEISLLNVPETVQAERQITLAGIASNITAIYLNGRAIVTDESGAFSEKIVLENGYTIVRIDAVDLYGRSKHIEKSFVYSNNNRDLSLLESTSN